MSKKIHEENYDQHANPMYNYYDSSWHADLKETDLQTIQSVTKSIISTLFGTAIDRGFIASIDQEIVKYFPDHLFYSMTQVTPIPTPTP